MDTGTSASRTRDYLFNGIKIAIGIGLLVFLYAQLDDPAQLWRQTLDANRWMLGLALASHALAVALSALKWGVLLRAQQIPVSLGRLLGYQWMAVFFDNFLPAQLGGDVLRGYSLARDTHRRADAAASVIIDRFTGLTAFMLAAALSSVLMLVWDRGSADEKVAYLRLIALGSSGISLALLTALALMLSRRTKRRAERMVALVPVVGQRLLPIWQKLAEAINAYRHSYWALIVAGGGSLLIVVVTSITIWLLTNAITPGTISFVQVLVINPIIAFLAVVPLSPGGLGVRQGAFAALFVVVGLSAELGFFVGLLQQLITYIVSLPGLLIWVRGQNEAKPLDAGVPDPL